MKSLCAPDNVACLVQHMPDTLGQIALIVLLLGVIPSAIATLTYRSL